MGLVRVEDVVLWISHIEKDEGLRRKLHDLPADATVSLKVAGRVGLWQKMKNAATSGRPTDGLKPQGDIKDFWVDLYNRYKPSGGILVAIEENRSTRDAYPEQETNTAPGQKRETTSRVSVEYPSPAARAAAIERIRAVRKDGWVSNGQSYGTREEWYAEEGK